MTVNQYGEKVTTTEGECHWCGRVETLEQRNGTWPAGEPVGATCLAVEEAKPWNRN
jgi:hypothetical protein